MNHRKTGILNRYFTDMNMSFIERKKASLVTARKRHNPTAVVTRGYERLHTNCYVKMKSRLIVLLIIILNTTHSVFSQKDTGAKNDFKFSPLAFGSVSQGIQRLSLGVATHKFIGGNGSYYFGLRNIYSTLGVERQSTSLYPFLNIGYIETIGIFDIGLYSNLTFSKNPTIDINPMIGVSLIGYLGLFCSYSFSRSQVDFGLRIIMGKWEK
jgi:hypothetical protein